MEHCLHHKDEELFLKSQKMKTLLLLLFVLGVEILAQKIRQSTSCRGIELPQSVDATISQFADDTTLICRDVNVLRENMNVLNKFNDISGRKLNKTKTTAMWIGSVKNNKTKPLFYIKILRTI